jgi:hypothetical protein
MVLGSKAKKGTNILESLAKEGEVGHDRTSAWVAAQGMPQVQQL